VNRALDELSLRRLAELVARWTGFQPSAVAPAALERALRLLPGVPSHEAVARAQEHDPLLVRALLEAVSCGETFFFRHPEHFQFIERELLPRSGEVFRVWSAGCATGEEAYSLAACLEHPRKGRPGLRYEILATDLLERSVECARAGVYQPWSLRPSTTGPIPYPLFEAGSGERRVRADLRRAVRFEVHNLLEPAPGGSFDLILCRTVLIYLAPEAAVRVLRNLRTALAPDGVVLFAPVDLSGPYEGMHPVSSDGLLAFSPEPRGHPACLPRTVRAGAPHRLKLSPTSPAEHRRPMSRTQEKPRPALAVTPLEPSPVTEHTAALREIERGDPRSAERALRMLVARAPDYLPGLLELALLWARQGHRAAAVDLMREVYRRASALPEDAVVAGPEPLAAAYYLLAARSFIERKVSL